MKKTFVVLSIIVIIVTLAACSGASKKNVVGISTLPATSLSSALVLKGIQDGAKDKGWDTMVSTVKDSGEQVSGLETLVTAGVKVIAIGAIDNNSVTDVLTSARSKGIKVFDTFALPENLSDVACSFDQNKLGYALGMGAGNYAKENWPGEHIQALVFTSTSNQLWVMRTQGVLDGLAASGADIEVVSTEEAWTTDEALSATESVLQAHPDVRMVLAINDAASLGAYTAFTSAGKTDGTKFYVGGIDLVPQVLTYMKEANTIYKGAVYLDLYHLTQTGIEATIDMFSNGGTTRQVIPVSYAYVQFDQTDKLQEYADLYKSLGY